MTDEQKQVARTGLRLTGETAVGYAPNVQDVLDVLDIIKPIGVEPHEVEMHAPNTDDCGDGILLVMPAHREMGKYRRTP